MILFCHIQLIAHKYLNLQHRFQKQIEDSGFDTSKGRGIPLPEYDWKNGSPAEFFKLYVKTPHPVVLRGFNEGQDIMKNNFDHCIEKYGEEVVSLSRGEAESGFGKLKEVVNPNCYLQNSEKLFNKYPKLWSDLKTERLEPYMRKKSTFAQFFIGRSGTGAPLHRAHLWNFFYMIDGSKRWYFIDPFDFYLAYPAYTWGIPGGYFVNLYPDEYNEEWMPAYKHCPYYIVDLQPGDVLLNPPWWGHGIRNTTDKSVGVATRWYTNGVMGGNLSSPEEDYEVHRWASFNFFTGPMSWFYFHMNLFEPSPTFDEHGSEFLTKRETGSVHFIASHKALAAGKVGFDGWRMSF